MGAKERTGARDGYTPRLYPSRAPVLSCVHLFPSASYAGQRHCLHLAYDLTQRSRGRTYELNSKVENADQLKQFVQFSAY